MEVNFKYKIGDWVIISQDRNKGYGEPKPVMVIERHMHECHGGVQLFYDFRFWGHDPNRLVRLTEMELEPYILKEKE